LLSLLLVLSITVMVSGVDGVVGVLVCVGSVVVGVAGHGVCVVSAVEY